MSRDQHAEVLTCRLEEHPNATVLHADGELDLSTLQQFDEALGAAVRRDRHVIVNATGLRYINGKGFRVLLQRRGMMPATAAMVLVTTSPVVRRLRGMLDGQEQVLEARSVSEAMTLLAGRS